MEKPVIDIGGYTFRQGGRRRAEESSQDTAPRHDDVPVGWSRGAWEETLRHDVPSSRRESNAAKVNTLGQQERKRNSQAFPSTMNETLTTKRQCRDLTHSHVSEEQVAIQQVEETLKEAPIETASTRKPRASRPRHPGEHIKVPPSKERIVDLMIYRPQDGWNHLDYCLYHPRHSNHEVNDTKTSQYTQHSHEDRLRPTNEERATGSARFVQGSAVRDAQSEIDASNDNAGYRHDEYLQQLNAEYDRLTNSTDKALLRQFYQASKKDHGKSFNEYPIHDGADSSGAAFDDTYPVKNPSSFRWPRPPENTGFNNVFPTHHISPRHHPQQRHHHHQQWHHHHQQRHHYQQQWHHHQQQWHHYQQRHHQPQPRPSTHARSTFPESEATRRSLSGNGNTNRPSSLKQW